jgi:hypothetical protein
VLVVPGWSFAAGYVPGGAGATYPFGCYVWYDEQASPDEQAPPALYYNPTAPGRASRSAYPVCALVGTPAPTRAGDTNPPSSAPTTAAPTLAPVDSITMAVSDGSNWTWSCARHCPETPAGCVCLMHDSEIGQATRPAVSQRINDENVPIEQNGCPPSPPGYSSLTSQNSQNRGLRGTIPTAIGQLSCRSRITEMCVRAAPA